VQLWLEYFCSRSIFFETPTLRGKCVLLYHFGDYVPANAYVPRQSASSTGMCLQISK
uniref:Uncharacterized protein n=1 Tax=Oryza brachyantha TaxID=4533 RepID=J3LJQ7_ORYBR